MKWLRGWTCLSIAWVLLLLGVAVAQAATVDVMIVLDTKAKTWVDQNGGMAVFAGDVVARMNQAARNSGVDLTFNLVHTAAVGYVSTANLDTDLDNLTYGTGTLATVHQWRDTYGADIVSMLVDNGPFDGGYIAGLGWMLNTSLGTPDYAFTVCEIRAVEFEHTLTHEVGHNFGAHHSKFQLDGPGPNSDLNDYSAGWYFTGTSGKDYHTIMAYSDDGYGTTYTEVPYFSSPLVSYEGEAVGDARDGDNARTLSETMNVVAAYRKSSVSCGIPSSLTVPAYDADGAYTVKWGASATAGVTYELQEATNSLFTAGLRTAYSGTATSVNITGRGQNVTYYYRVRAVKTGYLASAYRSGANGCAVPGTVTAGIPASITIPLYDADGAYTVKWGASATAGVTYELQEATNSLFTSGLRTAYRGTATSVNITGRSQNVTYYYRVRAVKPGCRDSAYRAGAYGCAVPGTVTAGRPASITVPAYDADGAYTVKWGASATAGVTYELQESINSLFSSGLRTAYRGTATSVNITGRTQNVTYYYRVRAVKAGCRDSAYRAGTAGCAVPGTVTAGVPASITVPAYDADGAYTVKWGASATAGVTYELQESINSLFSSGLRTAYRGTATSVNITGRAQNVTYYYRVRAVKAGCRDSAYRAGSYGCAVPGTVTAGIPASITVPAYDADGAYLVKWGASATAGVTYELQEATNSLFSSGLRTAYRGTATSVNITGRAQNVTYYYRVRAVKPGCRDSAYRAGAYGCAVPGTVTAGIPASITVPATDADGAYTIKWGVSATAGVTYELQEATNSLFTSGLRTAYRGTATSVNIAGRAQGVTYYYRVRAVKGGYRDSAYRTGGNGCRVGT